MTGKPWIEDVDALEHYRIVKEVAANTADSANDIIVGWVRRVCDDPTTRYTMSDGEAIIHELDKLVRYLDQVSVLGHLTQSIREMMAHEL